MIRLAKERIGKSGWANVEALETFTESVRMEREIHAFLFHYTHDILQSELAIKSPLSAASSTALISWRTTQVGRGYIATATYHRSDNENDNH